MLISDAWYPQVNGVVRTLDTVRGELEKMGTEVLVVSPDLFRSVPCPTYKEIRLAVGPRVRLQRILDEFVPDAIHVATEGPLGLATRNLCIQQGLPFTTAFHTRFPEYIHARTHLPASVTYRALRWFHGKSARVMVATESLRMELDQRGFARVVRWSRGVDTDLFRPQPKGDEHGPRPVFLYVGRVAVEKNISAFLDLDLPGTKLVVGDGPLLESLRSTHPEVRFAGALFGEDLARRLCECGRVRLPESDGHLRVGHARGDGLWSAGRCLPRTRDPWMWSAINPWGCSTRTCASRPWARWSWTPPTAAPSPNRIHGDGVQRSSRVGSSRSIAASPPPDEAPLRVP